MSRVNLVNLIGKCVNRAMSAAEVTCKMPEAKEEKCTSANAEPKPESELDETIILDTSNMSIGEDSFNTPKSSVNNRKIVNPFRRIPQKKISGVVALKINDGAENTTPDEFKIKKRVKRDINTLIKRVKVDKKEFKDCACSPIVFLKTEEQVKETKTKEFNTNVERALVFLHNLVKNSEDVGGMDLLLENKENIAPKTNKDEILKKSTNDDDCIIVDKVVSNNNKNEKEVKKVEENKTTKAKSVYVFGATNNNNKKVTNYNRNNYGNYATPCMDHNYTSFMDNPRGPNKNKVYDTYKHFISENIHFDGVFYSKGLRPIVIDGSNIAMHHGRGRVFSVHGLKICIDFFLKRGHKVYAFVPSYRMKRDGSNNQALLHKLVDNGLVFLTSSWEINGRKICSYDDRMLVQVAAAMNAVIVSMDRYRDLLKEDRRFANTIQHSLLVPTFVGDLIIFPQDPLGRYGPNLDRFLNH